MAKKVYSYLLHQSKTSNKFWSIETFGSTFIIIEGSPDRIRKSEKKFDFVDECIEAAERMIKEKLRRGFVENDQPGSRDLERMENQRK